MVDPRTFKTARVGESRKYIAKSTTETFATGDGGAHWTVPDKKVNRYDLPCSKLYEVVGSIFQRPTTYDRGRSLLFMGILKPK